MKIEIRSNEFEKSFSKQDLAIVEDRVLKGLETYVFNEVNVGNFQKYWSYTTIFSNVNLSDGDFIIKNQDDIERLKSLKDEKYAYDIEILIDGKRLFLLNIDSTMSCEALNSTMIEGMSLYELVKIKKFIIKKGYSVVPFGNFSLGQILSQQIRKKRNENFFKLADCLA